MQSENRLFDDLARVLNGAAGTFAGMGREAEASLRTRARDFVGGLDLVSRDEFEAVKAMARGRSIWRICARCPISSSWRRRTRPS
jgi:BMFP domain-containing protein YqiC